MSVMNHLAEAAAAILLLEVFVLALIFAALTGGLAFGLQWVNGKTEWIFGMVNGFLPPVRKYTSLALDTVAKPFIVLSAWTERVETTARSLQRQAAAIRARTSGHEVLPPPSEQAQPIDPLV